MTATSDDYRGPERHHNYEWYHQNWELHDVQGDVIYAVYINNSTLVICVWYCLIHTQILKQYTIQFRYQYLLNAYVVL